VSYFKIIAWGECPFCIKAKALLIENGFEFEYCIVDHAPELLKHYKSIYDYKTVPIVLYKFGEDGNETFIGGYTDLKEFIERNIRGNVC
jgi:glutaredoxin